jgi:hypothetical protein
VVGVCNCFWGGLTISFIPRTAAFASTLEMPSIWEIGGQFPVKFRVAFNKRAWLANVDW